MLSTHKKLLLKSALTLVVATPVFLATVMSCTPAQEESDKVDGSQGGQIISQIIHQHQSHL